MSDEPSNLLITEDMIEDAERKGACATALRWLREREHTWADVVRYRSSWAAWAIIMKVKGVPSDLTGLASWAKASVMIYDKTFPLELHTLAPSDRARVMVNRRDCKVDLSGLTPSDREFVRKFRPDATVAVS